MIGTEYTKDKCSFCGKEVSTLISTAGTEYYVNNVVFKKPISKNIFNKGKYFCNFECCEKYNREIEQQKIDYINRNKFTRFEIMDI